MALHTQLPIYRVAYDLLGLIMAVTKNMPRDYKASLGRKIQDEGLAVMLLILRANVATDKGPHLIELNERLQVIETLLRMARDMHLITIKQFAAVIALTDAAGKQCTGWRKSSHARAADGSGDASHSSATQGQLQLG